MALFFQAFKYNKHLSVMGMGPQKEERFKSHGFCKSYPVCSKTTMNLSIVSHQICSPKMGRVGGLYSMNDKQIIIT